jgi:hypothetical protein
MDQITETKVETRPLIVKTIGEVSTETVSFVTEAVAEVFRRMKYQGEPPEVISISQGAVVLPSGEKIEACYSFDEKLKPGKILVSTELSKKAFGESPLPVEITTTAFTAHEAVEHVNHMRGIDLLSSQSKVPTEAHSKSETEREANQTAREVIEDLYGWTVYFGDETPPVT